MFGPVRGPWADDTWKGWWGPNPPYHTPVFVLTHHRRALVAMEGGTTFHFVTDDIQAALERARDVAQGRDVRLGGGVATIRQYLRAGLVDEMHLAIAPTLLGSKRGGACWHRPNKAGLRMHGACWHAECDAYRSDEARAAAAVMLPDLRQSVPGEKAERRRDAWGRSCNLGTLPGRLSGARARSLERVREDSTVGSQLG
jgi:dihydrofolate reductase